MHKPFGIILSLVFGLTLWACSSPVDTSLDATPRASLADIAKITGMDVEELGMAVDEMQAQETNMPTAQEIKQVRACMADAKRDGVFDLGDVAQLSEQTSRFCSEIALEAATDPLIPIDRRCMNLDFDREGRINLLDVAQFAMLYHDDDLVYDMALCDDALYVDKDGLSIDQETVAYVNLDPTLDDSDGDGLLDSQAFAALAPPVFDSTSPLVAPGLQHTIALKSDGTALAWGSNYHSALGDGTNTDRLTPVSVGGLNYIRFIDTGDHHAVALRGDGTVYAWGSNFYGQLGDATNEDRTTPVLVQGLPKIIMIGAQASFNIALGVDGKLYAWGNNARGQLGDGTTEHRNAPILVQGIADVTAFSLGAFHVLAAVTGGDMYAWGDNTMGQLGDYTTTSRSLPVPVQRVEDIVKVSAGALHSFAMKADGTLYAWGANSYGQLGNGSSAHMSYIPTVVHNLPSVETVATGGHYNFLTQFDGTLLAWGRNNYGQLGNDTEEDQPLPLAFTSLADVAQVYPGSYHTMAVTTDGDVYTWGANYYGQLGDGTTSRRHLPVQVSGLNLK